MYLGHQGFVDQCQTVGVFYDLGKAYDTTWHFGIIKQLQKMGIKRNMIWFINSFLSDRLITVRVRKTLSFPFRLEEGVPTGNVLSGTYFAIAMNLLTPTGHNLHVVIISMPSTNGHTLRSVKKNYF